MVLNSTAIHGEANSSKTKLIINTSDFNSDELNNFITLSEQIERNERLRNMRQLSNSNSTATLTATKMHEEMFDSSLLDGDIYLTALENQTTYVPQITDLDESIENMMKYFEEDVDIRSTAESTPTKVTGGKVAAVVDKLKAQSHNANATPQRYAPEIHANIKELRKNFELNTLANENCSTPKQTKQKSPKVSRKSRVKQMAQLFNTKIIQIMRKDADLRNYEQLQNEFSPEPVPAPTQTRRAPLPKPRTVLPIYAAGIRRSPVPSPRLRRKQYFKTDWPSSNEISPEQPKVPMPSPSKRRNDNNTCLVAEDVFRQLSVKDKALLYNKFIEDMSKKNPKFSKHAQIIEAKVKKQFACGEVVNEKQVSVKTLKEELEAKCAFPKQTVSPWALKRLNASYEHGRTSWPPMTPVKAKEAEDIFRKPSDDELDNDERALHISTLTVVLKPSPLSNKHTASVRASLTRRARDARYLTTLGICETTSKRNNTAMHSSLPIEAYAPPRKIRRTRAERLAPKMFFQNQHLERLFYSWLKERNGVSFDIATTANMETTIDIASAEQTNQNADVTQEAPEKSAVDRLLEEAIAKLETVEQVTAVKEQHTVEEKHVATAVTTTTELPKEATSVPQTPKRTLRKNKKAPAPPIPAPRSSLAANSLASSVMSSAKHSEADESESGLSSIPKITTDDSQPEQRDKPANCKQQEEHDFVKPIKPPRKKKSRRTLTWKKDNSIVEANPITTTDSDSDYKSLEPAKKPSPPTKATSSKNKASSYMKKLLFKTKPPAAPTKADKTATLPTAAASQQEASFVGLDKSLLRTLNSPRKIRSAYTLTVMSSPSPNTESEYAYEPDWPKLSKTEKSRSLPSLVGTIDEALELNKSQQIEEKAASTEISSKLTQNSSTAQTTRVTPGKVRRMREQHPLTDSFIDQGFETGSNELDSPIRKPQLQQHSFSAGNGRRKSLPTSRRLSADFSGKLAENNPSGCSTPVKGHVQQTFTSGSGGHQQQFSPITTPLKTPRRRSIYDSDASRRNSLAMQVIREDQPLDTHTMPCSPNSFNANESAFFANAPTLDMSSNIIDFNTTKDNSMLWITAGDFTITTDIFYNSRERIRCLYNIFSQKSFEAREIHFGIDNNKFCFQNLEQEDAEVAQRLPKERDTSHYWFQTSDLVVPFSGKYMPPHRIKRLFKFISEALADNEQIRIGIDAFEFCVFELNDDNEPEFLQNQPKFSIESSYSMLIGLQSGQSNGLEGRSKYAWPSTMSSSTHSNNIRTSDLGNSGCESEEFDGDMGRLSFSPFGTEDLNMRRTSESGMSAELFSLDYENEPLDQLFKDNHNSHSTDNTLELHSNETTAINNYQLDAAIERTRASVKSALDHLKDKMPALQNDYEYTKLPKHATSAQSTYSSGVPKATLSIEQMLDTLQKQQTKLKIVLDTLRAYAENHKSSEQFMKNLKNTPDYDVKLQEIVKSIEEIGYDNGFKHCTKVQLESFMYFLSHYADLILSPYNEHMNKILDTLLERRAVQV